METRAPAWAFQGNTNKAPGLNQPRPQGMYQQRLNPSNQGSNSFLEEKTKTLVVSNTQFQQKIEAYMQKTDGHLQKTDVHMQHLEN